MISKRFSIGWVVTFTRSIHSKEITEQNDIIDELFNAEYVGIFGWDRVPRIKPFNLFKAFKSQNNIDWSSQYKWSYHENEECMKSILYGFISHTDLDLELFALLWEKWLSYLCWPILSKCWSSFNQAVPVIIWLRDEDHSHFTVE